MLDHYWLDTAEFVRTRPGRSQTVIGPREFMSALPEITPYDSCTLQLLERRCLFIIHKGMTDRIYQPALYAAMLAGALVFSNDVFLVLDIPGPENADHMRQAKSFIHTLAQSGGGPAPATTTARSPSCYLGNSRAICTTVHGHKMIVDTSDVSIAPHLLTDGYWEEQVTRFLRQVVQPTWSVVEVGANFGYHTLLLAQAVGPKGSVTAFEANPRLFPLLFRNVELNGYRDRTTVECAAVCDTHGSDVEIGIWEVHACNSSLFASSQRAAALHDGVIVEKTKGIRLDDYFPTTFRIDLLKLDVEGAEPLILRGARRLLQSNANIRLILEFDPDQVRAVQHPRGFLESLSQLGFQIHRIEDNAVAYRRSVEELLSIPHSELYLEPRR